MQQLSKMQSTENFAIICGAPLTVQMSQYHFNLPTARSGALLAQLQASLTTHMIRAVGI
jgi:hypothetical protein